MRYPLLRVGIQFENDISLARQRLAKLCTLVGFSLSDRTRLVTALSEIARNALRYAGGGTVEVFARTDADGPVLEAVVSDSGPGIPDLEAVLAGTYESRSGMGLGIVGARRLVDQFTLESSPETGTCVRLAKRFPPTVRLTAARAQRWAVQLARESPKDVYELLQMQNQELLGMMQALQAKEQELDSQLHRAESLNAELRAANARLQEEIQYRRRAEQELLLARDAAEAAARAKADFLANMSHEIRTPLNAVLGLSRLLRAEPLPPEAHEMVALISQSGQTLLAVINDILDFSKIESGKLAVERIPMDLHACLEGALAVVAPAASEKGLELVCDLAPQLPETVQGDPVRIRQVLVNLIGNAVKFTPSGHVVLSVGPGPESDRIRFQVSDTGVGIPPDRLEAIFEAFSQADTSTTRLFQGTGLGLTISRRLVDLMGGALTVESSGVPGEGACFAFSLPLAVATEAAHDGRPSDASEPPAPRGSGRPLSELPRDLAGRRVLLVEPHPLSRTTLARTLREWKMQVVSVSAASLALERVSAEPRFDLAILSWALHDSRGDVLAAELRGRCAPAPLPVVLMRPIQLPPGVSVHPSQVDAWVIKPVLPRALGVAIRRALGLAPASSGATGAGGPDLDATLGARHPLRILLAEDNAVNQRVARMTLARLGYEIDLTETGAAALEAVSTRHYDLVLMDVHMPEMDGLAATRAIRSRVPADAQPRIVAMTASVLPEEQQRCIEAGMDGWLPKPLDVDALVRTLTETPRRDTAGEANGVAEPSAADAGVSHGKAPGVPAPAASDEGPAAPPDADPQDDPRAIWQSATEAPVLNPAPMETFSAALGGGEAGSRFVSDLIQVFLEDAPAALEDLRRAVAARDPDAVGDAAHALKGSAANLGGDRLAQLCFALERLGRQGRTDGAEAVLRDLEAAYRELTERLQETLAPRSSDAC